jgi:hypothetical protein
VRDKSGGDSDAPDLRIMRRIQLLQTLKLKYLTRQNAENYRIRKQNANANQIQNGERFFLPIDVRNSIHPKPGNRTPALKIQNLQPLIFELQKSMRALVSSRANLRTGLSDFFVKQQPADQ